MPDPALTPAVEAAAPASEPAPATAVEAPVEAAPVTPVVDPQEAVYDAAVKDLLASGSDPGDEDQTVPQQPALAAPVTAPSGVVLSASEEQALRRAGLEPEDWAGWDRAKIEARADKIRKTQVEQERMASELDRFRKAAPVVEPAAKPKTETKPVASRLAEHRAKLLATYDDEITPMLDAFDQLETDYSKQGEALAALTQQAGMVPILSEMIAEMVFDQTVSELSKDYPSLLKPEARAKVQERFFQEWGTGAYNKPNTSFRQQMREAASNAAKVTFATVTEQQAAASLVTSNKARLAAQPRTGPSQPRLAAPTKDGIYDEAYTKHLAPELANR